MRLACSGISSWFSQNATIVTPTAILARVAVEHHNQSQIDKKFQTWQRPATHAIGAWLTSCWQEARYSSSDVATLLSPDQERALWHRIIQEQHPHLFDIGSTVGLAQRAASFLAEWQIRSDGELWNDHPDAQQFQLWLRLFRKQCRENHWITRADLWRLLPEWLTNGNVHPSLTVFLGFKELSPGLLGVQQALGPLAVVQPFDARGIQNHALRHCSEFPDELVFAARRTRYLFEKERSRSIGIFVPELAGNCSLIERALTSVFFPAAAFRINSGKPLFNHPLVASALLLLELAKPRVNHADADAILRCPFIKGAAAERSLRALADLDLRKRRELDVALRDIAYASKNCPELMQVWRGLDDVLRDRPKTPDLSRWSEWMGSILAAMGWPGDAELSDAENSIVEAWNTALSNLSALGLVCPAQTYDAAVAQLRGLLSREIEQGDWSAPIQVFAAKDAAGLEFDHTVVVGLSDETWPPVVSLSPLIPFALQRIPELTDLRQQRRALTRALFESAPNVTASYSGNLATIAKEYLGKDLSEVAIWNGKVARQSFVHASLEQLADSQAPRFVSTGDERGGTGIIKAQSLCPFRAFVEYRLQARTPDDASFGFDARERGGFLHEALQNIWQKLESSDRLRLMPEDTLRSQVREAIADAVKTKEAGPLHQLSAAAERDRLEELILDWLNHEKNRKQSFTVQTVEQDRTFEIPGLTLKLRVDRIDKLRNGNLVLIDYKSGEQTKTKLTKLRPAEPQLLVYAASLTEPVDGIFFGQLKVPDVKAVGFSREKIFDSSKAATKKDWDEYIGSGREIVHRLATEFVNGMAAVDPIKGACDFCAVKPICRINEIGSSEEDED